MLRKEMLEFASLYSEHKVHGKAHRLANNKTGAAFHEGCVTMAMRMFDMYKDEHGWKHIDDAVKELGKSED